MEDLTGCWLMSWCGILGTYMGLWRSQGLELGPGKFRDFWVFDAAKLTRTASSDKLRAGLVPLFFKVRNQVYMTLRQTVWTLGWATSTSCRFVEVLHFLLLNAEIHSGEKNQMSHHRVLLLHFTCSVLASTLQYGWYLDSNFNLEYSIMNKYA